MRIRSLRARIRRRFKGSNRRGEGSRTSFFVSPRKTDETRRAASSGKSDLSEARRGAGRRRGRTGPATAMALSTNPCAGETSPGKPKSSSECTEAIRAFLPTTASRSARLKGKAGPLGSEGASKEGISTLRRPEEGSLEGKKPRVSSSRRSWLRLRRSTRRSTTEGSPQERASSPAAPAVSGGEGSAGGGGRPGGGARGG